MTLQPIDLAYPWQFKNESTAEIPAFGALRVTGWVKDEKLGLYLQGNTPGTDEENSLPAINASVPVPAGSYGVCAVPQLFWGAVKAGEDTGHGDTLGIKDSEELLVEDQGGYQQLGALDTEATPERALLYRPGGGGGGSGLHRGLLIADIDAGTVDGTAKTITPGMAANAVVVIKWSDDGTMLEEDTDIGTIMGTNGKLTGLRGSVAEPIEVYGEIETVNGEKRFSVINPEVIRGNPDWILGAAPSGDDDPALQILHHKGDQQNESVASGPCDGEAP